MAFVLIYIKVGFSFTKIGFNENKNKRIGLKEANLMLFIIIMKVDVNEWEYPFSCSSFELNNSFLTTSAKSVTLNVILIKSIFITACKNNECKGNGFLRMWQYLFIRNLHSFLCVDVSSYP